MSQRARIITSGNVRARSMNRLTLLLMALWTVKVLAVPRVKRAVDGGGSRALRTMAAEGTAGGEMSPAISGVGSTVFNTTGAKLLPARRFYESKPEPNIKKKRNKDRSTSSSSAEKAKKSDEQDDEGDKESLQIKSESSGSSSESKGDTNKRYVPKSTKERHGWKKWHRKCTPCPADQKKKWRDPTIKWVCGAYQRARRSFKSLCLMRYRNCQDGTMFVPLHDHRCANSSPDDSQPHGEHFMYDYKVTLSDDSSGSKGGSSSSSSDDSSSQDSSKSAN